MALTLQQTDTAPGCSAAAFCSGRTLTGGTPGESQASEGGTAGITEDSLSIKNGESNVAIYSIECVVPDGYTDATGNWTVNLEVTTGTPDAIVTEVHVCRVNSSCVSQESVASSTGLSTMLTAGSKQFTPNQASAVTWAAGDTAQIVFVVTQDAGVHGATGFGITPSATIEAPGTVSTASSFSITGSVTVPTTIAATLAFTLNAAIAGAVTVTPTVAATTDYTLNRSIAGDVSVPTTVAATMTFNTAEAIAGDVTVPLTVAAGLDYTRNASLAGSVSVPITVAGTTDYTLNGSIAGDVTVPVTVSSPTSFTGSASIAGDVTVPITISSPTDYTLNASIAGAVTVPTTIAAGTTFTPASGAFSISGDVTVQPTVAAALDYTLNGSIAGDVTVPLTVASGTTFTPASGTFSITGDVTVPTTIGAGLDYTLNRAIAGSVTVPVTVAGTTTIHYVIVGTTTVPVSVAAGMTFTPASSNEFSIAGAVQVPVSVAAGLVAVVSTIEVPPGGFVIVVDGPRRIRLSDRATRAILTLSPASVRVEGGMPFTLRVGETTRPLRVRIVDGDASTPDLTGATVTFSMVPVHSTAPTIEDSACTVLSASPPSDPDAPNVSYDFEAADVMEPGNYWGEFKVDYGGGSIGFYPSDENIPVTIRKSLT